MPWVAGGDVTALAAEGHTELSPAHVSTHGETQKLFLAPLLPTDSARGSESSSQPASQQGWQGRGTRERWWQLAEEEEDDDEPEEVAERNELAVSSAAVPSNVPSLTAATPSHGGCPRVGSLEGGYADRCGGGDNVSLASSSLESRNASSLGSRNDQEQTAAAAAAASQQARNVATVQMAVARAAAQAAATQQAALVHERKRRDEDDDMRTSRGNVDQMRSRLLTCTRLLRELQAENSSLNESLSSEHEQRVRLKADAAALRRENVALRCENEALLRADTSQRQETQLHKAELLQAHTALATIVPELERKLEASAAAVLAAEKRADCLERQLLERSSICEVATKSKAETSELDAHWSAPVAG